MNVAVFIDAQMIKSMPLPDIISKRYAEVAVSQAHRDITDDKYRELRRPRKVRFFVNGDRYYPGKKLHITPHRYMNFSDLLNDLTGKISHSSSLPYGVRSIYTPVGGHRVKDIEDLEDKASYVCGGFESFKAMKYGRYELEHWSVCKYIVIKYICICIERMFLSIINIV